MKDKDEIKDEVWNYCKSLFDGPNDDTRIIINDYFEIYALDGQFVIAAKVLSGKLIHDDEFMDIAIIDETLESDFPVWAMAHHLLNLESLSL
jgi:hypothetical protein